MRRLLGGVGGVVVLGGLGLGYKLFLATPIGGTCSDSNECRGFSGECLEDPTGSYCTKTCAGSQDCPVGWTCTTATSVGQVTSETAVCGRPFAGAPAVMPGEAPAGPAMPGMTGMPMPGMPMTPVPGMPMTPVPGMPMTPVPGMPMTPMPGFPATAP